MKILIASSLKNLERLQSYLLPDAEKGLRLFTANNKLQLRFGKNGKSYTLFFNIRDGFIGATAQRRTISKYFHYTFFYLTKAILHLQVTLIVLVYRLVFKQTPRVFVDADTRTVPMIFRKLIGSANVIHVQCQNCLPTYEMQIAQKIRNKSQNVKLPRVFGYGPAGRMLHLPTFIPNIEVNVAEKYELYRPQWFYEHVKGGISKKEIYKKFRRVLWLDNDSGKVYTDHQIRRRQQQKIVFFKHLLSQDKQLTLVFRPHPVWSKKTDLKELDSFGSIEDRFELDITGKSIESVLQDFDLVLVTYSTAVFEVIASHVAVIFISIDEDVMAEAWSEELKLPLIKIPSENQVTLEEIQARSPEYDEIFKKQFERFFSNEEND